ncbi:MAG: hypothetical protein PF501_06115, partial [Salinisphaera sp.]|nr:hypothetical protein [Salinisphaera sp.]
FELDFVPSSFRQETLAVSNNLPPGLFGCADLVGMKKPGTKPGLTSSTHKMAALLTSALDRAWLFAV